MPRLRPTLDRPLHRDGDPYDDGPLPDLTSGLMWLATGVLGLIVQWLPGTGTDHVELVYGLCLFAIAWGAWSVFVGLAAEGIGDVGVTFAWAVSPTDAEDGDSLLSQADQRLLANKRASKSLVA
jgi:hypothetical protein